MKQYEKGDKYRPVVTIEKVKNGLPTVITVSGEEYVLRHKDQYKRGHTPTEEMMKRTNEGMEKLSKRLGGK